MPARTILHRLLCLLLPACAADAQVTGVVVDEQGRPISGATCAVLRSLVDTGGDPGVQSDSDGRFRISVDGKAPEVLLVCAADGFVTRATSVRDVGVEQRVVLIRGGVVRGRLRVDEGIPVEQLAVEVEGGPSWRDAGMMGDMDLVDIDTDGRFTSQVLPPGPVTVRVKSADHPSPIVEREAGIAAGDGASIDVDLRGQLRQVELSVVDESGEPVRGFSLTVTRKPGHRETWADIDGGTGMHRVLVPRDAPPLRGVSISRDGFLTEDLDQVSSSTVVTMSRCLGVDVRLDPAPALADGERIAILAIQRERTEFVNVDLREDGVIPLLLPE